MTKLREKLRSNIVVIHGIGAPVLAGSGLPGVLKAHPDGRPRPQGVRRT